MISVIIPTRDSERTLVPTLAALVSGAIAGTIREVIMTDAGSSDGTAAVADAAGCRFVVTTAPLGARLKSGADMARAPWLMFLHPGTVPDATWVDEVTRFLEDAELAPAVQTAAVFRRAASGGRRPILMEAFALIAAALGTFPRPEQGLLIPKQVYDALGGHLADDTDPESGLLRRLGRRRIVVLRSGAVTVMR